MKEIGIMYYVNERGFYEDYLYIGHLSQSMFDELKYRTKKVIIKEEDKLTKLYKDGWFPTFVKRWEWYMLTKNPYYKPIRHNLRKKL